VLLPRKADGGREATLAAKSLTPKRTGVVVNETICLRVLRRQGEAYPARDELLKAYPASAKLTATLIRNAAPSTTLEDVESRVPLAASEDPEVLLALTRMALGQSRFDRAEAYARRAIAANPRLARPLRTFGRVCLSARDKKSNRNYWVSRPAVNQSKIREGIAAFDRAIQTRRRSEDINATVEPLLRRAVCKALLGDEDGADDDFSEAARLAPDDPAVSSDTRSTFTTVGIWQERLRR